MRDHKKKREVLEDLDQLKNVGQVFEEIEAKIEDLEFDLEDITTEILNVENQNKMMEDEVKALCKLIDALRAYNSNLGLLKRKLLEVGKYL